MTLYATREDTPAHVPQDRIVDYDTFVTDGDDGDCADAMALETVPGVAAGMATTRVTASSKGARTNGQA